jgi:hypothetical protein
MFLKKESQAFISFSKVKQQRQPELNAIFTFIPPLPVHDARHHTNILHMCLFKSHDQMVLHHSHFTNEKAEAPRLRTTAWVPTISK